MISGSSLTNPPHLQAPGGWAPGPAGPELLKWYAAIMCTTALAALGAEVLLGAVGAHARVATSGEGRNLQQLGACRVHNIGAAAVHTVASV